MATRVGTEPPRCSTQGRVPGGVDPAAPISRRVPRHCLPAPGDKDGDSPAAPRPPASPYPASALPQLGDIGDIVRPTNPPSAARQPEPGPSDVPQPPRGERRAVCVGRHVPSSPATSARRGRPRLVSRSTSRPAQMPAPTLAGTGTRVGGSRAPKSLPSPGSSQLLAHPGPLPAVPGGGSGPGRGCISLPDTSLSPGLYLKGGKSQLGARHRRVGGGQGRGALSAVRAEHAGCGVHHTQQHGKEDAYRPGKAWPW